MSPGHILAVVLAAFGAVLFGLSAVHQHGAVLETMTGHRGVRQNLRALLKLVRRPDWLVGTVQGLAAGVIHVVALALAPITLVQPIGVLAVPVTVVASAVKEHRHPSRTQVVGALLSVGGIAILTVLLLTPKAEAVIVPHWGSIAVIVGVLIGATIVLAATGGKGPPLVRCVSLAGAAALLFGLNSVLIRLIGHLVRVGGVRADLPTFVIALLGLCIALPVGLWAMQSAYLRGSPHVVICCLTLIDPLAAVLGGRLMLHDGVAVSGLGLVLAGGCAVMASVGVVLLSLDYPEDAAQFPADAETAASR